MTRWQEWSGANSIRRQAQKSGRSYAWYLEKGKGVLDDRLVRAHDIQKSIVLLVAK